MHKSTETVAENASFDERFTARVEALGGWRGETLTRVRALIHAADPAVEESWKWNIPVWEHAGLVCTGEVYKAAVKLTFAKGAALDDPKRLFNSSLDGATRRAIDIREGEAIDEAALKALFLAGVARNLESPPKKARR